MSTIKQTDILKSIQERFVGTMAEHDALKDLLDPYSREYDRGYRDGENNAKSSNQYDQEKIALAAAYQVGSPIDASILEWKLGGDKSKWRLTTIADRLKLLGISLADFDEIRPALAKVLGEEQPA